MTPEQINNLTLDDNGQYITLEHEGYMYYAYTPLTQHLNMLFNGICKRGYLALTYDDDLINDEHIDLHTDFTEKGISIVENIILERHDGVRISMTWSEWGDITII